MKEATVATVLLRKQSGTCHTQPLLASPPPQLRKADLTNDTHEQNSYLPEGLPIRLPTPIGMVPGVLRAVPTYG